MATARLLAPRTGSGDLDRAPAQTLRPGRAHRNDIQGLRAVAVGLVVAYHAGAPGVSGGFVGVDVFLVLSGYLITGLLVEELRASGGISLQRFYARRARRLLPMSTLVLVVTALALGPVLSPLDRPGLAGDLLAAAAYVPNWHFALQSLDYLSAPDKSPVLHYWSLSVEEQFYVVWPLVLMAAGSALRGRGELVIRRLAVVLSSVAVLSFIVCLVVTPRSAPYAYYGLHTRAWELASGGLLALVPPTWLSRRTLRGPLGWLGLGLVGWSAVAYGPTTPYPGSAALVPVLGTVLVLASGLTPRSAGAPRLLSTAWLTYVGGLSYAWYLWHWPCLVLARELAPRDASGVSAAGPASLLLAVLASFVLAVISHHLIEDPVRRSRWLAAIPRRSLALAGGLTACSLVAGLVLLATASTGDGRAALAQAARRDVPVGNGLCYVGYAPVGAAPKCQFGDPHGTRTIVLVGDSHAQQWFPALQNAARTHHWQLWTWTKSNCPFVDVTVRQPPLGNPYTACTRWRTSVVKRIAALPHVDQLIVSHFSAYAPALLSPDGSTVPSEQATSVWNAGWRRTIAAVQPVVDQVVVLGDTPSPGRDVPACLAEHGFRTAACSFSRAAAVRPAKLLGDAERAASAGQPHIRFLDVAPWICATDPCRPVTPDGTVVFRDSAHLTASRSRELSHRLADALADSPRRGS